MNLPKKVSPKKYFCTGVCRPEIGEMIITPSSAYAYNGEKWEEVSRTYWGDYVLIREKEKDESKND